MSDPHVIDSRTLLFVGSRVFTWNQYAGVVTSTMIDFRGAPSYYTSTGHRVAHEDMLSLRAEAGQRGWKRRLDRLNADIYSIPNAT